jgi:YD repeat-containing protein
VRLSAAALYSSNFTPGLGPASNTRALWKFDGQTTNDSSGNANHGTLQSGATYSTSTPSAGGSQRPVAMSGGPYSAQMGQSINFSSTGSYDPDGAITSYHWNFGDGSSANTANSVHTYQTSGLFTATLTVTDNTGLRSATTAAVTINGQAEARLDARNQTGGGGENPLSQNFNWNLPLLSLSGRAGMNLDLALSYNSLIWTKNTGANYISFDDDRGFPAPGFRLGFPTIQSLYYNSEIGKYAFLLIGPDGSRIELRQVGTSTLYESADSAHLLLDAGTMVLRTSEGTQLNYSSMGNEYNCTQIKDRNGNLITVNYTAFGRIDTIVDTLARTIKFNYSANGLLTSITQAWNQTPTSQVTHNWAVFTYADTLMQTSFPGMTVYGPANNSTIKTLSTVTLADGSRFDFSYTSWGQIWKVANFAADNHLLNQRAYNLPGSPLLATGPQDDCPRFTQRRDWAQYWNGDTDDTPVSSEDAVTSFAGPVSDTWTMPEGTTETGKRVEVTSPDGTLDKIYFIGTTGNSSAWRRGLPALVVTYSGGVWQRKISTSWTQDNTSVTYTLNPRVTETNVYDPAGNRARTRTEYQHFIFANGTSCDLPQDVFQYAADAVTVLRSTRTVYNADPTYTNRRILGLISDKSLYEGDVSGNGSLMSKLAFFYDESGSIQGTDAPVQHDSSNYNASFVAGRGNLSSVKRYDVINTSLFTSTSARYDTSGSVVSSTDAGGHSVTIGYTDAFSDGINRNTLAYPTVTTDPDGYSSTSKYTFDFGALTRRQTPQPNTAQNLPGPEKSWNYDSIGRVQKIENLANNAYTRFEYAPSQIRIDTYATVQEGLGEAHSFRITDGAGRVIATAIDHNLNTFSGQKMDYDIMGRVIKTSNSTETTASGPPSQWTTTGDDAGAGWIYTEQTYDWKSRPLVTINPSLTSNPAETTTRQISYSGCGCAGGEGVTVTDEGTIDAGVAKRRQQKIYSDVLGRTVKTETLNWQDGSVYSTTVNTYNGRDQVTQVRRYAGAEGSGSYQVTTFTYDGYGRVITRHRPEQQVDPNNSYSTDHTTWIYNADNTIQVITDSRGASQSFSYNGRHLVPGITYAVPAGISTITPLQPVGYGYDGAGNRTSMTDGSGRTDYTYDQLSRMQSETRQFSGVTGSYALNYDYNLAGELKAITDPAGATINYGYDLLGRIANVSGSAYGGVTQYASVFAYRAWGAIKGFTYGNNLTLSMNYNARLKSTQFEVAGQPPQYGSSSVMKTQYQYYDDGALKYADDLLDNRFDRAYGYDQTARLKEGYSGSEASDFVNQTSSGTTTGPYRQSFSYDVWSSFTSRTGRFWSRSTTFTAS